jgi:hypothetical protein
MCALLYSSWTVVDGCYHYLGWHVGGVRADDDGEAM